MKVAVNLRFEKDIIEAAKRYALERHTSVSEIVESYLKKITTQEQKTDFVSDGLVGILKEYRDHTDDELKALYLKGKHGA